MTHILTRQAKGAALTYGELDGNFIEVERRTGDGWDDLVAPMDIQVGSPYAPTRSEWMDGMFFPEFTHTTDLAVIGTFHVNHRYKPGTMMYPHFHFSPNDDAESGVVVLGFRYKLARRHDSTGQIKFTTPVELRLEFNISANSSGTHFVAEVPEGFGIPSIHIEPDAMILMETFRRATDPSDTFNGSIWGLTHDIHYECDRASTPNRAPDFYA